MNFQPSSMRNHFFPFVKPFLPISNPNSLNASLLPKLFCQALKASLQRFVTSELQKPHRHEQVGQVKKHIKNEPEVIELLSSDQEVQKEDSKMNEKKRQNLPNDNMDVRELEQKTDESKDHVQFLKQCNKNHQKQEENFRRKTCLIRKQKNQKGPLKMKKSKYLRVEQRLDLTETVELKGLSFSGQQLNKKRQALLLRSVLNWDEAGLQKKERREIRMLKN